MQTTNNNAASRNLSALVDFSNLVNSSLDLNFALNNILLTCFGKFQTTKGIIALADDFNFLNISLSKGIAPSILEKFPSVKLTEYKDDPIFKSFIKENKFVLVKEIDFSDGPKGIIILGAKLIKQPYDKPDMDFLQTILNIGATAIENSINFEKLKGVNRNLDSKVNQLSSLFDLSKEFSGILDVSMVTKLLVFSIIGQLFVSKYAVVTCEENEFSILVNKFPDDKLKAALGNCNTGNFHSSMNEEQIKKELNEIGSLGVKLIIPMKIKNKTKGLILLAGRQNNLPFSQSDIEYASSVGGLAIISIENSRLFKETIEKQKLEKDLELATNIQKNLLPTRIPELPNFEISAYNETARHVGGDYYDVVQLPGNRLLFAIGDVSGKGVQAALLMANLQAFLQAISKQNILLPDASNLINDLVSDNTTDGSFITFFWGILNNDTLELEYVNAGHNPPLLVRNSKIQKLKIGGMILGVMQTVVPYQSEKVQLQKGDAIILFTDGITEAMNLNDEEYTDERLEELATKVGSENSKSIINRIISDVRDFCEGAEQSDDITSLIIKVK